MLFASADVSVIEMQVFRVDRDAVLCKPTMSASLICSDKRSRNLGFGRYYEQLGRLATVLFRTLPFCPFPVRLSAVWRRIVGQFEEMQ